MSNKDVSTALIASVADLDEKRALELVQQRLNTGDDPLAIVGDCQLGLRVVGERYEQRQYFLAGLIMAGEIFRQVMVLLQPSIEERISGNETGRILLGTVQGDIHDIGKNNLSMLLRCYGFVVHDLGVNIPPEEFVAQTRAIKPDIVGLSGLLSISRDAMRETVRLMRASTDPTVANVPIIIGGGLLNKEICDYVGADYWETDAMDGVRLCQSLLAARPVS
jgi:methanogenic corrinoid protein MtbC1